MVKQLTFDLALPPPTFAREDFVVSETNREALAWMDGFHKGADEREREIRTAIGKLFADHEQDGDIGKLLAMLTTWMPQ